MIDFYKALEILSDPGADLHYRDVAIDDAHLMALEAIKKQIPQIPAIKCADDNQWLECPTCGNSGIENDYRPEYCTDCGQKIDWSEWELDDKSECD